jgi:cob(I)alamin adenosyltransferase
MKSKSGDKGISDLNCGIRLTKTSIYFELIGDLDELNCHVSVVAALWRDLNVYRKVETHLVCDWKNVHILKDIQKVVNSISKFIETPPWHELKPLKGDTEEVINEWVLNYGIKQSKITSIENVIETFNLLTTNAIISESCIVSNILLCRAIARRCERRYIQLLQSSLLCYGVYENVDTQFHNVQIYLNRLSDFFSVLSRFISLCLEN